MNPLNTLSRTVSRPNRLARLAAVAMLLGGAAVGALAQYKIVGPDGKVTYTDKPPAAADIKLPSGSGSSDAGNNGMPYETRQAMAKYPVTIFTTKDCSGCDMARQALRQRGVPFTEFTVNTSTDFDALQSRFGNTSTPVVQIGTQAMKGYSSADLSSYLDAAGYPAQARLTGYSWPPARSLAPPPATVSVQPTQTPPATSPLPQPSKSGIQF
jgi:glutaredoxin